METKKKNLNISPEIFESEIKVILYYRQENLDYNFDIVLGSKNEIYDNLDSLEKMNSNNVTGLEQEGLLKKVAIRSFFRSRNESINKTIEKTFMGRDRPKNFRKHFSEYPFEESMINEEPRADFLSLSPTEDRSIEIDSPLTLESARLIYKAK